MAARLPARRLGHWPVWGLRDEMDKVFDTFFGRQEEEWGSLAGPPLDIAETEDAITVKAELPGVTQDDLDVSITGNVLTIKGEKKHETETNGKTYHRIERRYGNFHRSLQLGQHIETKKVKGEFADGVLTLTLPKAEEAKPKKLKIDVK